MNDMETVTAILQRLVKPDAVQPWLNMKNPGLGQRTPMEAIQSGEIQCVIELRTQLEEAIHI